MTKLKFILLSMLTLFSTGLTFMAPAVVHADIKKSLNCGAILLPDPDCTDPGTLPDPGKKVNDTVTLVINLLSIIVGIVAVIMIIVGGLKYITSSGESSNITGAKNTILYAVVGLVVVALAQFIVRFVLGKVNA